MVNNRSGSMRLDRLYSSKTDKSKDGAVRKAWREHLGIDEGELRVLAHTLAFGHVSETLEDLRERLDEVFGVVGLVRVPSNQSTLIYVAAATSRNWGRKLRAKPRVTDSWSLQTSRSCPFGNTPK